VFQWFHANGGRYKGKNRTELIVVSAAKDFDRVGEEVRNGIEGFDGTCGAAGKIDDDGFVADNGNAAREDGGRSLLDASAANFLGDTRDGAIGDVECGLRRGVARAEAGAASGQQDVGAASIGDSAHLTAHFGGIIGAAKGRGYDPAKFTATRDQRGSGEVFAFTAGDGIANGKNGDAHVIRIMQIENG